jgi:MoaA/NifB/PqqE/SkfB family radical SAM enzyme
MEKHSDVADADVEEWVKHWKCLAHGGDMLKITPCFNRVVEDGDKSSGDSARAPCAKIFQTLDIVYSGDVLFCSIEFKASGSKYRLGNLENSSISDIWNSEKAAMYRELHRNGRRDDIEICRGCDVCSYHSHKNIIL